MNKLFLVLALSALGVSCGGTAVNVATNTANKPANAASNPNSNSTASNTAGNAASTPASSNSASNAELDFTLVNKTGYAIKQVFVGPASSKEWAAEDEILKGRTFGDGATMDITFHPKATAKKWDLKVEWADGSPAEEWLNLDLTQIEKLTLKYDKAKDVTSAEIE
jgi:hypothetical protein